MVVVKTSSTMSSISRTELSALFMLWYRLFYSFGSRLSLRKKEVEREGEKG